MLSVTTVVIGYVEQPEGRGPLVVTVVGTVFVTVEVSDTVVVSVSVGAPEDEEPEAAPEDEAGLESLVPEVGHGLLVMMKVDEHVDELVGIGLAPPLGQDVLVPAEVTGPWLELGVTLSVEDCILGKVMGVEEGDGCVESAVLDAGTEFVLKPELPPPVELSHGEETELEPETGKVEELELPVPPALKLEVDGQYVVGLEGIKPELELVPGGKEVDPDVHPELTPEALETELAFEVPGARLLEKTELEEGKVGELEELMPPVALEVPFDVTGEAEPELATEDEDGLMLGLTKPELVDWLEPAMVELGVELAAIEEVPALVLIVEELELAVLKAVLENAVPLLETTPDVAPDVGKRDEPVLEPAGTVKPELPLDDGKALALELVNGLDALELGKVELDGMRIELLLLEKPVLDKPADPEDGNEGVPLAGVEALLPDPAGVVDAPEGGNPEEMLVED